jgi:hypothetical protein
VVSLQLEIYPFVPSMGSPDRNGRTEQHISRRTTLQRMLDLEKKNKVRLPFLLNQKKQLCHLSRQHWISAEQLSYAGESHASLSHSKLSSGAYKYSTGPRVESPPATSRIAAHDVEADGESNDHSSLICVNPTPESLLQRDDDEVYHKV